MLIDDCVAVEAHIEEVMKARREIDRLASYQKSAEKLQNAVGALQGAAGPAEACRALPGGDVEPHEKVAGLSARLTDLVGAADSQYEQIVSAAFNFAQIERDAQEVSRWTAERVKEVWQAYILTITPSISPEVLDLLEAMPAFTSQIRLVRARVAHFQRVSAVLPGTSADIEAVRATAEAASAAFLALHTDDIPPEVWQFLRAATSPTGATLASLTPAVSDWLKTRRLDSAFSIRQRIAR
jgi:hypothetical protein